MTTRKLTIKQERFAREYVNNGGNGHAAYQHAYDAENMKAHTIDDEASRLTLNPDVAPRIQELVDEQYTVAEITHDHIVSFLKSNGDEARAAGKYSAAARSYELLGKAAGMFQDAAHTVEVNVNNNNTVVALDAYSIEELDTFLAHRRELKALDDDNRNITSLVPGHDDKRNLTTPEVS